MAEHPASNQGQQAQPAGQSLDVPVPPDSGVVSREEVAAILRSLGEVTQALKQIVPAVQPPAPPGGNFTGRTQSVPGQQPAGGQQPRQMPTGKTGSPIAGMVAPAMPMNTAADVICGKEGTVKIGTTDLPEITKWTFNPQVNLQEYASNKTNGFKRKVCGSKSATGSIEGKWDRSDMITDHFTEGSSVTLLLHMDATNLITAPVIIKSLSIEVDINENAIEGWSADFETDGQYTYSLAGIGS